MNLRRKKVEYYMQRDMAEKYDNVRFYKKQGELVDAIQKQDILQLANLNGDEIILDVGTGTGRIIKTLAEHNDKNYAVDTSGNMLKIAKKDAKKQNLKITFLMACAENLPFKDECFDLVISIHLLRHMPTYTDILKEFLRITKKNGGIIIDFPNKYSMRLLIKGLYHPYLRLIRGEFIYDKTFTLSKIKSNLQSVGLSLERIVGEFLIDPRAVPSLFLGYVTF